MKKKVKQKKSANEENFPSIFAGKKKKIFGILIILFSIFILLSIISYSRFDKANLSYSFSDFYINHKGENILNWLGILGAYVSDFFINSTLGIFSIIFPVLFLAWGGAIFVKISFRKLINTSNFIIISAILLSSFFGILRIHFQIFSDVYELSGSVGDYLGLSLSHLLGGIGSIIFLLTAAIIILILAFDIKIENIFHDINSLFAHFSEENMTDSVNGSALQKDNSNLNKIKELGKSKKKLFSKDRFKSPSVEELKEDELKEQTRIRIIRKDETPAKQVVNEIQNEEHKKVDLGKTGEIPVKEIDKDKEVDLPNQWEEKISYKKPGLDLLEPIPKENFKVAEEELKRNAELLKEKLKLFDIDIKDISVTPGPVVTLYEIVPAPGVKISRIVGLEHDIALALAARGIRIIAPIPGKSAIGVEIPNAEASLVNARSVLSKISEIKHELPIALGKQINGEVYTADLSKMPHLLIAGSTGSGKSVGINMIIASLLYTKQPSEVKLIMIDPKKIELSFYNKLRRHYLAVSPDLEEEIITNPQNAVILLKSVEYEMEKRYDKLAKAGVRNIVDYNQKVIDPKKRPKDTDEIKHHPIPYLIVIIDELADLMITAGKEVEEPIARLAQLARAVGIHLVLATQRPSVNVITGVIKANFSARIAYQVATKIDSRTILDMNGAEQLLGRGDMLFLPTGSPKPIRIQNAFISTEEVEKLTNYINLQPGYSKPYFLPSLYEKKKDTAGGFLADLDPMFEDAARIIVRHQQGSVSLLQRRLKLGYSRAARIVDQLEEAGIVGPNDGSKARTVLVENDEQLETILRSL
ncbi:MAG: DNA translocase FtsK 4TM domain-containing protein [Ignavibacteriaceae bacterium]|jgi:S-DNA-T family DNA segregation ATPase FtsK/SpoIIIE